ncbi:MAG TPA: BMP family ABC transporter substrate-binding protein [Gaiellaceae bacterium]|nr:BMP family ABC transporter substrate-binding protein [Gaiellaceae bacterium]
MRARRLIPLVVAAVAAIVIAAAAGLAASGSGDAATRTYKVGLVSDVGRFNDRSFNQSALDGLRRAQRKLAIQGRAVESRQTSDYIPNLSSLARDRYDLTISVGFLLADATNTVANQFPNSKFAIIDYSVNAPPFTKNKNVRGLTFATNENSYMIGCLSALMAKQRGRKVISAVGGIKLPTVDIFIAGYRAGANRCVRGTKVLIGYSQDFVAQDKCKEIALNQIAQGSRVVFQVAGGCGLGALDAAKERGVWGLGVDKDQKYLGRHILTSAVKRVDQSVYLTAAAIKAGKFKGGVDAVFNLKNGGVAVGKIDKRVPKKFITRMNALKPLIISGKIKPPKKL